MLKVQSVKRDAQERNELTKLWRVSGEILALCVGTSDEQYSI